MNYPGAASLCIALVAAYRRKPPGRIHLGRCHLAPN